MEGWQVFFTLTKEDLMCFWEEKEEDECVKKKLVFMCEEIVIHEKKNVCKQKAWEEVVCSK